ncbi:hypothetical protein VP1G_03871 [Cytospora mali]|uniref:Uncharacterized protein n=1 Tax=Cytospora mali TaxID=578113 RepID=A0A194UY67_CYTMA|nr:hypothetical protein VP1G_03871 [Valsa mali var. pyri (nom. inval.)]
MPIPLFSQGNPGQGDHEKSPVSGQSEREDGSRGSLMGALGSCLGVGVCPPYTTYQTVPAYQSAPSVTGYDSAVSRAYSAEMLSPVRAPIHEYPVVTSSGPGQTGLFDIEDPAHTTHLPNYPPLQPVSHYGSQPTTSPESMVYPSLDTDQDFLKSETSPVYLKSEGMGQGFRAPGFPNVSTPMQPGESTYAHDSVSRAEDGSYIRHGLINYQLPPRYRITHAYAHPDGLASEQVDHCQIVSQGNGLEVVLPNHKPPSTKRGPFKNQEKRQQTAHCEINPEAPDDDDAPCDGCKKILANSKIHRLPCRRWKITEVKLFKPGQVKGYEWTCRWKDGTAGPDIGQWANPEVKIIRLTEGYGDGVELRVRRFVPQPGDKLERTWVEDGKMQRRWIEPYALIDLEAAKASYETYLRSGLTKMCKALLGPTEKLLWRTYEFAILRAQRPDTTEEERELIRKTLDLWAAVRLTTKSFEIIGKETLGIPKAKGQPVPIPPVMGAQIDNILLNQTLPKLRRETLETLQTMTQAKKPKTWLTTYLVSFILLHNVALITAHDEGYAKKHGMETRFARKDMVEQYHLGANIFLAYYHYCNKSVYPFSKECKDSDLQNLAELDQTSINFVKYTRSYVEGHKSQWEEFRAAKKYGNDYYFLSQLYEQDWSPQPTIVD